MRYFKTLQGDMKKNYAVYFMVLPLVLYYIVFSYLPMYGILIAFKDYSPFTGVWESEWVGLKYFRMFFESEYSWKIIRNTLVINLYTLVLGFPAPIIFSLLLNEIRSSRYKKTIQTVTYMPHFISIMVVSSMIISFCSEKSFINDIIVLFGGKRSSLLSKPELFPLIYAVSGIWQELGWESVIYLAALSSVDMELYEAAKIDGANKFRQVLNVTLPGILPTIVILLILRIGRMMNVGFEKIILIANPLVNETAEVISSFVYKRGLQDMDYSYTTAIGLFNSLISFLLLTLANGASRKLNDTSLW